MEHRPEGKRRSSTLCLGKHPFHSKPKQLDQAAAAPWETCTPGDLADGHIEALP